MTGWVAARGEPLFVPDVSQDPRYLDAIAEIRSEMCVPLKIAQRVIGVIDVESDEVNAFSEDDLRLLSTLAGQLATTMENVHLFAETERKANDLALLLVDAGEGITEQDTKVIAQLSNSLGTCWTSEFTTAGTKKNEPGLSRFAPMLTPTI